MALIKRFGFDPLQGQRQRLDHARFDLLANAFSRTGVSDRGLPLVQLDLTFKPRNVASNPEMSLALMVDSSGSMQSLYAESIEELPNSGLRIPLTGPDYFSPSGMYRYSYVGGHIYEIASAVLNYTGDGYDLVFFDDEPAFVGPFLPWRQGPNNDLLSAIAAHDPSRRTTNDRAYFQRLVDLFGFQSDKEKLAGAPYNTYFTGALQAVVQRCHTRKSLFILVITDGFFEDTNEAWTYVVTKLLPQLTPDNPYAFRLHVIGLGGKVNRPFLEQLETDAAQQSVLIAAGSRSPLVKHHHHHRGHGHEEIFDELGSTLVGIAPTVVVGEPNAVEGQATLLRVGNMSSGLWFDGPLCDIGFVPLQARISLELINPHPPTLDIVIRYTDGRKTAQEIPLRIPLPRLTATTPPKAASRFHLPWGRKVGPQ